MKFYISVYQRYHNASPQVTSFHQQLIATMFKVMIDMFHTDTAGHFTAVTMTIQKHQHSVFRLVFLECSLCRFGANAAALIVT